MSTVNQLVVHHTDDMDLTADSVTLLEVYELLLLTLFNSRSLTTTCKMVR